MNSKAWKCYRCELIFKEESHALLHKELSNHPVTKVGIVVA